MQVDALLNLSLTLAFFGGIAWLWWRSRRAKRRAGPVTDDPNQAYQVYTREFDLELNAKDLERRLIGASPDYAHGWLKLGKDRWRQEIHLADELVETHREEFQRLLGNVAAFDGHSITLLIDQSGSMEGDPMRWAAVSCRLAMETLQSHSCKVELLGFSTAGWRGGFAYQKWQNSGRPKRPGRLCATLHVAYKQFDEPTLDRQSWEALLNPNVLRENVDGEALEWVEKRLLTSSAAKRHLIILSDGAPVDDATLTHNGVGYLARHTQQMIARIESDGEIDLSAIGVRHAVGQYYARSREVQDLTQLPKALACWLADLGAKR